MKLKELILKLFKAAFISLLIHLLKHLKPKHKL